MAPDRPWNGDLSLFEGSAGADNNLHASARELWRQRALEQLGVLDTPAEDAFDGLVRAAAALCGTPIALISLIDRDRQWFKANVGLAGVAETPRAISFCTHAINQPELLEVEDASCHPLFSTNPLVLGEPHIRFYAGAPLRLANGATVGTLCVVDHQPQRLSPEQRHLLLQLATTAVQLLEGRRALQNEIRLRQQAEQLAAGMPIGLFATDAAGAITFTNPRWREIFGLSPAESLGQGWINAIHPDDRLAVQVPLPTLLADQQEFRMAFRLLLPDGGIRHLLTQVRSLAPSEQGPSSSYLGFVQDVTEEVVLQAELRHQASHDVLTGLLNRRAFDHQLRQCLEPPGAGAPPPCHALLYIDLDQFKIVNDAAGHGGGDQVLVQVARLLKSLQGEGACLARLGGDEFGLLLPNCPLAEAEAIAARIIGRLEGCRFSVGEQRFRIGLSIGVVPINRTGLEPDAVLRAADSSCFTAKEGGRNRWHVWRQEEVEWGGGGQAMRWVTRLQQSLDDDLLELHAQRILPFDGDGADPLQVELLLRIREPDGSLVLPAAFLPPAERFQIVNRLDLWVLRRTLDLLEAQPALEGIGRICLNVSGQSVADRSFLTSTQELLDRAGPQVCRRLCFEITETAAISNEAAAGAFIASLRQRHCSVALDDFGSGMASFGSLKTLALTHLKIDGQFVRGLIDDRLDGVAVRCFVEVAAVLGLRTVAESVESAVVLERLRQIGVHEAQGYHLHRPEPFAALLTRTLANPPG